MHPLTQIFLPLAILVMMTCQQPKIKDSSNHNTTLKLQTGQLLPIDFSDTNNLDLSLYAVDTTTGSGWSIRYFVKDDSTKHKDVYISCSKGSIGSTYRANNVLEYRRYFIPQFKGETKTNIYFTHGCATDCSAILVFDKDSAARFADYLHVVKYDFGLGHILYVTDSSYNNEQEVYELAVADLSKHKTHKLTFQGICDGVYKPACVDTAIFSKNKVSVTVSLRNRIEGLAEERQTKTVRL